LASGELEDSVVESKMGVIGMIWNQNWELFQFMGPTITPNQARVRIEGNRIFFIFYFFALFKSRNCQARFSPCRSKMDEITRAEQL
jgi:hypothetical protein